MLQRADGAEPQIPVDGAHRVVEGLAQPQPRRPWRRCAPHRRDRLLLRRRRVRGSTPEARRRGSAALVPRARRSCGAGRVPAVTDDMASGAPLRPPAQTGLGPGARCRRAEMSHRRIGLFLGLGLVALPISVIVTLLQAGLLRGSSFLGIPTEGEGGRRRRIRRGRARHRALADRPRAGPGSRARTRRDRPGPADLGRAGLPARTRVPAPAARCLLVVAFVVSLLATTVMLVPIAIWVAVQWALVAPVVALEEPRASRRARTREPRPSRLVQGGLTGRRRGGPGAACRAVAGRSADPPDEHASGAAEHRLGCRLRRRLAFVALATVYVYFDMRVRDELPEETSADTLPAEIRVSN